MFLGTTNKHSDSGCNRNGSIEQCPSVAEAPNQELSESALIIFFSKVGSRARFLNGSNMFVCANEKTNVRTSVAHSYNVPELTQAKLNCRPTPKLKLEMFDPYYFPNSRLRDACPIDVARLLLSPI